jgi:NAD(P)-dependent dehydrogenase (short-subunit alcohol dehydrogenase family)
MTHQEPTFSGRVAGKVAVVTGAASGIGRATALLLAQEGASVAVTDLDLNGAEQTGREIEASIGTSRPYQLDVTSEEGWQAAIAWVLQIWGRLDILVNNAGISFAKPVTEMTLSEWHRLMAINLDGVFLGTQQGLARMKGGNGGSIVNISSASGLKGAAGASAYATSKAAVRMFSRIAALEGAPDNIRVNTVLPGGVMSPLWQSEGWWQEMANTMGEEATWQALAENIPLKRFADPEEIAFAVLYLASDESRFVTGSELVIDGGYAA